MIYALIIIALAVITSAFISIPIFKNKRPPPILSTIVVFLSGLVFFQVISPTATIISGETHGFAINDIFGSGIEYGLIFMIFVPTLLITYHFAKQIFALNVGRIGAFNDDRLFVLVLFLLLTGLAAKTLVDFTFFAAATPLAYYPAFALCAFFSGRGIARKNQGKHIIILYMLAFLIAIGTLLAGSFGRRMLLGVMFSFIAGFTSSYSSSANKKQIIKIALIGGLFFFGLSLYTDARDHSSVARERTIKDWTIEIGNANFGTGALKLLSGQDAGASSLWIVENGRTLSDVLFAQSLWYPLVHNIPRDRWPDKPTVMSNRIHYFAGFRDEEDGTSTRSTGVVVQALAEGGLLMVPVYAIAIGILFGFMDRFVRNGQQYSIFGYAIVSVAFAYVMGLARGDVGIGLWRILYTMLWAIFYLKVYNIFIRLRLSKEHR